MAAIGLNRVPPASWSSRLRRRVSFEIAQRRLEHDFARLMETAREPAAGPGTRPKVAFATFGSGRWHLVLETLLAHALVARGASVELLVCDLPRLPVCDERTSLLRDPGRCPGCFDEKRRLLEMSRLEWQPLSRFVEADEIDDALARVAALPDRDVAGYVHDGLPLGEWTYVSACHFLRADARGKEPEKIDVRRRFVAAAIVIGRAVARWLDQTAPDVVVAESGAHFMWKIAFELARARGIRVVCREIGKGGWDTHIYSLDAECMFPDLTEAWHEARSRPLSSGESDDLDACLDRLPARTYGGSDVRETGADALRQEIGIAAGRRVVLVFTNVVWDLATAGRDAAFDGMYDWLSETIAVARETPDLDFVIRVHPAENAVPTRERVIDRLKAMNPLPKNVRCIGPQNALGARSLSAVADLVVAYCSSAGIEAAIAGKPVALCGKPHFHGRGFTIDIGTKAAYAELLRALASGRSPGLPPDSREIARRYAYLFFRRYHIDMGWTTSPLEPPFQLKLEDLGDLLPGRSRAVDVVCAGILDGRPIVL